MNKSRLACSLFALAVVGLAGCDLNLAEFLGFTEPETQIAKLRSFETEDELKTYLVGQNNLSPFERSGGLFFAEDADSITADDNSSPTAAPNADGADGGAGGDESGSGENGFSTTTEQEEGVQESDVIKNDGEYLYVLSRDSLRIVRATPANALEESGHVELDGYGYDMFLVNDHVVTITTPSQPIYLGGPVDVAATSLFAPDIAYYRPQTVISVIEAADRSNPQLVSTTRIDGSVSASRMIGDRLYLVMVNYPDVFVQPLLDVADVADGEAVPETRALKGMTFDELDLDDILPDIAVEVAGSEVYRGNIAEFDEHFRPEAEDGLGLTSIVTFDIADPASYDAQTVVAYPANVYVSPNALYLTDTDYNVNGEMRESTDIFKFDFTDDGVAQAAAGTVPGRVLNQYSMSEYNGYLRVATTKGRTFGPFGQRTTSTNNVYVLEKVGDEFQLSGSVEDLAPDETIFSARFIGDRGYLVTFEQIDPLFTLDLSDPTNPQVVGELKVPGFSTFITPMGNNHLLTVGRDTNDFGFSDGVRLSIFDVSDFANPSLAHVEVIGSNGSAYSEAIYNPKAFTYFAESDLLALPVEIYGYYGGFFGTDDALVDVDVADTPPSTGSGTSTSTSGDSDDAVTEPAPSDGPDDEPIKVDIDLPAAPEVDSFRGLYVYRATPENGFEFLGRISSEVGQEGLPYYSQQFIRGAFIGDNVYCATSETVQAAELTDVSNVVSMVTFPTAEIGDGVNLPPTDEPVDDGGEPAEEPEIEPES